MGPGWSCARWNHVDGLVKYPSSCWSVRSRCARNASSLAAASSSAWSIEPNIRTGLCPVDSHRSLSRRRNSSIVLWSQAQRRLQGNWRSPSSAAGRDGITWNTWTGFMPILSAGDLYFYRNKNINEEGERRLTRRRPRIGEPQAPVCIPRKLGQRDDSNHAGTERSRAAHVLPGAFSRIEPLRPVQAAQFGAANLAARTALLEIRQENILVRRARAVRPTLVGADMVGLVGRDEVGQGNQFLVALADGESKRAQILHLLAGVPLECVPHLGGSGRFDIRAPNALGSIDVPGEAAREEIPVHRRAYELVVLLDRK